ATKAEGAPPYWPWLQVLRSVLRAAGPSEIANLAGRDLPQILQVFPELRDEFPDKPPDADVGASRFQSYDAIAQLLAAVSRRGPMLLVLEDMHWSDATSLILLQQVAAAALRSGLIVLVTYRDRELGTDHPLKTRSGNTTEIGLAGLDDEDAAALFRNVTAFQPTQDVIERLQEQTAGNPLFLKEIARTFREDAPDVHAHRAAVPTGVASILTTRISALSR